jgi:hypothetical protein
LPTPSEQKWLEDFIEGNIKKYLNRKAALEVGNQQQLQRTM